MGNTYGNVTLAGIDIALIEERARERDIAAFLLPVGDHVAVFTEDADEDAQQTAIELAKAFGVPALGAFVFDSDVLLTWLVVDGEVRDTFVSDAGVLDELEGASADDAEDANQDEDDVTVEFAGGSPSFYLAPTSHEAVATALRARGYDPETLDAEPRRLVIRDDPGRDACHALAAALSTELACIVHAFEGGLEGDMTFVDGVGKPYEPTTPDPIPWDEDDAGDSDDWVRRPRGGDATALCAAFGGDPEKVGALLRGDTPVDDPVFHAESLHAALARALGLPAGTVGNGFGHLAEGIELGPDEQARLVRVP